MQTYNKDYNNIVNKPYFPSVNTKLYSTDTVKVQNCSDQIQIHKELVNILRECNNSVNENWKGEQESLAFFVEATRQLEPDNWKDLLKSLKNKILDIKVNNPLKAELEIRSLLLNSIAHLYKTSLAFRVIDANKLGDVRQSISLERTLQAHKVIDIMSKNFQDNGKLVSLNIVRNDFIPSWFNSNEQEQDNRIKSTTELIG